MDFKPSRKGPKPKNLVQSIERVSIILDVLSSYPQGLCLGDLAGHVDLSKGTVHRLLSSLAFLDYVRQDPLNKKYHLGFKLVELSNILLNQLDLRKAAHPHLLDLAERLQETAHLVVRDYDEALYIDKVELHPKQSGLQMVSRLGSRMPMHCCSVGKVLLAHLPEKVIDEILLSRGLPAKTANTITDIPRLKIYLQRVRKNGFAIDNEENEKGIRCIAAPILNDAGKVVASISVSGPATRITLDILRNSFKEQICATATEISRLLGFQKGWGGSDCNR